MGTQHRALCIALILFNPVPIPEPLDRRCLPTLGDNRIRWRTSFWSSWMVIRHGVVPEAAKVPRRRERGSGARVYLAQGGELSSVHVGAGLSDIAQRTMA